MKTVLIISILEVTDKYQPHLLKRFVASEKKREIIVKIVFPEILS